MSSRRKSKIPLLGCLGIRGGGGISLGLLFPVRHHLGQPCAVQRGEDHGVGVLGSEDELVALEVDLGAQRPQDVKAKQYVQGRTKVEDAGRKTCAQGVTKRDWDGRDLAQDGLDADAG